MAMLYISASLSLNKLIFNFNIFSLDSLIAFLYPALQPQLYPAE